MNIMVVFLLSGLWHGADWTFMVWGGMHGVLLVAEGLPAKLKGRKRKLSDTEALPVRLLRMAGVFVAVTLLWGMFRAEGFWHFREVMHSLFSNARLGAMPAIDGVAILFLILFVVADVILRNTRFDRWCIQQPKAVQWAVCFLLAFCTVAFASVETFPFIYFQF